MQAARIQAMRDSLEQQLEHCKSKEEAAKVFSDTMSMVSDKDPMKEYIVAAYQDAYNEFQKSGKYQHLPQKSSDDDKSDSLVALDKTTDFLTDSTDHRSERKSHQDRYDPILPPNKNAITITVKSNAIRIRRNGTFGIHFAMINAIAS